jgi:hypothetical protein
LISIGTEPLAITNFVVEIVTDGVAPRGVVTVVTGMVVVGTEVVVGDGDVVVVGDGDVVVIGVGTVVVVVVVVGVAAETRKVGSDEKVTTTDPLTVAVPTSVSPEDVIA